MKLINKIFAILLIVLSTVSCTKDIYTFQTTSKLEMESTLKEEFEAVSSEELDLILKSQMNFILIFGNATCGACTATYPLFNRFIKETSIKMYKIEQGDASDELKSVIYSKQTPSLNIFKAGENGEKAKFVAGSYNITTYNEITNFLYAHIVPGIKQLNLESVRSKIDTGDEFMLYIGRSTCSTCRSFRDKFFNNYLVAKGRELNIYFFDSDEVRIGVDDDGNSITLPNDDPTYASIRNELSFRWTPTIHKVSGKKIVSSYQYLDNNYYSPKEENGKYIIDYSTFNISDNPSSNSAYDTSLNNKEFNSIEELRSALDSHYQGLTRSWFTENEVTI